MWKKGIIVALAVAICVFSFCMVSGDEGGNEMKNGYYTAEMSGYSHGWKEYACILVKNDSVISVEFNAKDPSGFIKAWDNAYMNDMKSVTGTYPNAYTRLYGSRLIEAQDIGKVDTVTGATHSGGNFYKLVSAALDHAKEGNSDVAIVESEDE